MISFRAFRSGHGVGLAVDFVSTVGVCAFSERMEEAAGPIFRRYPRLEVGPPPPPSAKRLAPRALCWTCQTKQAGAVPILSGKMKEASSSCQQYSLGGGRPSVCRTCGKVSRLT